MFRQNPNVKLTSIDHQHGMFVIVGGHIPVKKDFDRCDFPQAANGQ